MERNCGPSFQLYVGKLPREVLEDELIPLFEETGKLYDLRLMMDPVSGYNKGYAFVTYVEKSSASTACQKVNPKRAFFTLSKHWITIFNIVTCDFSRRDKFIDIGHCCQLGLKVGSLDVTSDQSVIFLPFDYARSIRRTTEKLYELILCIISARQSIHAANSGPRNVIPIHML